MLLCWKQTEERNFKYSKFKTHIFPRLQNIFNWSHVNGEVKRTFFIFSPKMISRHNDKIERYVLTQVPLHRVLELVCRTKNNLILLIKQFKQFLLNWITNISLLTLQPFIANIGRMFFSSQLRQQLSTFTCWSSLFGLLCSD